jgi:glycosyltransferase involved in cell wall biosynthesis
MVLPVVNSLYPQVQNRMIDVTIGIASFNEARNIGNILDALIAQKSNDEIKIVQIIVSDDSSDGTERLLKRWASRDRRIRVFHHPSRQGYNAALNEIFVQGRGVIVIIDADVLPADDRVVLRLVSPMIRDPNIGICAGAPCALETKKLMGRVSYFAYTVWNNVRRRLKGGSNFFSVNGRIFAISSAISRRIKIPDGVVGGDAYTYLSCIKLSRKVQFVPDATVYYQETQTLHDFLIRRLRYEQNVAQLIRMFGNLAKSELAIPRALLFRSTLKEGLRDPLSLFIATTLTMLSKLHYRAAKTAPHRHFSIATSTKRLDLGLIARTKENAPSN